MNIEIRRETEADYTAIDEVNRTAFEGEEEVDLVRKLRIDGDVLLSLVAEVNRRIVGHILMSRMAIETPNEIISAVALAPVAVHPDFQNQGIGSGLIRKALELCASQNETIVLVLGYKSYYPRFSFSSEMARHLETPFKVRPDSAFMALELMPGALDGVKGRVRYAKAFGLGAEWTLRG